MKNISKISGSTKSLVNALKTSYALFDNEYIRSSVRRGTKTLRKPLLGSTITQYYPPDLPRRNKIRENFPLQEYISMDEYRRQKKVVDLKKRGKGHPKKLQEKREKKR